MNGILNRSDCPADAWKSFTDTLSGIVEPTAQEVPKEAPKPDAAAAPSKGLLQLFKSPSVACTNC